MHIVILIPAFILFLYYLYKLAKDDYVLIRKNISLEQMFDITFLIAWISLFSSRLLYYLFNPFAHPNIFVGFFSLGTGGFSFFGALIGGAAALYLLARYKKFPIGRLFDFFTLALVVALPVGFVSSALFMDGFRMLSYLGNAVVYLIFAVFCVRYVHPKLNSRELKEGNLQVVFLLFLSVVLVINATMLKEQGKIILFSIESIVLFLLFLVSLILFLRQAKRGFINTKKR